MNGVESIVFEYKFEVIKIIEIKAHARALSEYAESIFLSSSANLTICSWPFLGPIVHPCFKFLN
jgi:hypothetical protein